VSTPEAPSKTEARAAATRWLEQYGDRLYRHALALVRDSAQAEDLVQDTLLAAFAAHASFRGEASEYTWLVRILRNRVTDLHRRTREVALSHLHPDADEEFLDRLFDERGHWRDAPPVWSSPEAGADQRDFWRILELCLGLLPERQVAAFRLLELEGADSDAVCKVLEVSASNLWVLMHRARARLMRCMTENGLGTTEGADG